MGSVIEAPVHRTGRETVIERVTDPIARRVRDVLRAGSRARNTIVVDDEQNIRQALRAGVRLDGIYLTHDLDADGTELVDTARADGTAIYRLDSAVTAALFGDTKRARTFALAAHPPRYTLDNIARRPGDILLLDGVRLAGNIGALIRTASAFRTAGLLLVDSGLASVYDRRLIRASRGLVFTTPVVLGSRTDVRGFLDRAEATLVSLAATAPESPADLAAVPGRVAILLGSETAGPSRELDALASRRFAVPMHEGVESLNVSVAGAIALYERRAGGKDAR